MFTHTETRAATRARDTFANSDKGRIRRTDRRNAIARKSAFLVDGLTIKAEG